MPIFSFLLSAFILFSSNPAPSSPSPSVITRALIKFEDGRVLFAMTDLGPVFYFFDGKTLWKLTSPNLHQAVLSYTKFGAISAQESTRLTSAGGSLSKLVMNYANEIDITGDQPPSSVIEFNSINLRELLLSLGWSSDAISPPQPSPEGGVASAPTANPYEYPGCCLGDGSQPLLQFCAGYCEQLSFTFTPLPPVQNPPSVVDPDPGNPVVNPCDDGNPCTIDVLGTDGNCYHSLKNCDDDNPCTYDYCDSITGACVHVPIPGCNLIQDPDCEDGIPCTIDFKNAQEQCVHVWKDCSDNNPCTGDYCEPSTGACVHVTIPGCEPPPPPPPCQSSCSLQILSPFPSPLCSQLDESQTLNATVKLTNTSPANCATTSFTLRVSTSGPPNITPEVQNLSFSLAPGASVNAQVSLVRAANSPGGEETVNFQVIDGGNCSASTKIQVGEAKCSVDLSSATICKGANGELSLKLNNLDPYCAVQYQYLITQSGIPNVTLTYSNPGSDGIMVPPNGSYTVPISVQVNSNSPFGTELISAQLKATLGEVQKTCEIQATVTVPNPNIAGSIPVDPSQLILLPGSHLDLPLLFKNQSSCPASFTWRLKRASTPVLITPAETTGQLSLQPGQQSNGLQVTLNVATNSPEGSVPYELSIQQGEAWVSLSNVTIQVAQIDLAIFKPKVIDSGETGIPEEVEVSQGSQTWVNLDNDDQDGLFDNLDDVVEGGDNELVKVQLRLKSEDLNTGNVKLSILSGPSDGLRAWKAFDKQTPYSLGSEISAGEFILDNGMKVKDLYLEGVLPGKFSLQMSYTNLDNVSLTDEVSLTVLSVKSLEWVGMGNGYTANSNANDSDELDDDPNFPENTSVNANASKPIDHKRVFPDARWPETKLAHDLVRLKVSLEPAPVFPVTLYLRPFDIDDPSSETQYIDPNDLGSSGDYFGTSFAATTPEHSIVMVGPLTYTADEDNRGEVNGQKFGEFEITSSPLGIGKLDFEAGECNKEIRFKVSIMAGDNYRAAVSGDWKFLQGLRNLDKEDGLTIVDSHIVAASTAANREIQNPYGSMYESPVLTVWKLLHVELHSMPAVPMAGVEANQVIGSVVSVSSTGPAGVNPPLGHAVNAAVLDVDLTQLPNGPDLSLNFESTPQGSGRFCQGSIAIGSPTSASITSGLTGNGKTWVYKEGGLNLSAELFFPGANPNGVPDKTVTICVAKFDEGAIVLNSDTALTTFIGGKIKIGGVTMPILGIGTYQGVQCAVIVAPSNGLAFVLKDDDDNTRLPHKPDFAYMKPVYSGAYILPLAYDQGNTLEGLTWHPFVPFKLNVKALPEGTDLIATPDIPIEKESPVFWVANLCTGFQADQILDGDTNEETRVGITTQAVFDNIAYGGGDASWVFIEAAYDGKPTPAKTNHLAAIAVHEMGHQLGLLHTADVSVMMPYFNTEAEETTAVLTNGFNSMQRNLLRSRRDSPKLKPWLTH